MCRVGRGARIRREFGGPLQGPGSWWGLSVGPLGSGPSAIDDEPFRLGRDWKRRLGEIESDGK